MINNQTNESNISPLGRDNWSESPSKLSSEQTGENISYADHNIYLGVSMVDPDFCCIIVYKNILVENLY